MDKEKEVIKEEVTEEVSSENEIDFEELVKNRVTEETKELRAKVEELDSKYNKLLEQSKKRTVINFNSPFKKEESLDPIEKLSSEFASSTLKAFGKIT